MAKLKILPTCRYLQECFIYDPNTGLLTWRHRPLSHFSDERIQKIWNTQNAHQVAGWKPEPPHFNISISIDGLRYQAHRIIWKLVTGMEPPEEIDHRDRDSFNNRWKNLRAATRQEQNRNRGIQSNNKVGIKGVSRKGHRYRATIILSRKQIHLGTFDTPEEAGQVYMEAAKRFFGEFVTG